MKPGKGTGMGNPPDLETDALRYWKARPAPADQKKAMQEESLAVGDGERIHEAVVIDLGGGYGLKLLSKERAQDGLVNVLVKVQGPGGRTSVIRSDRWMTKEDYDEMVAAVRQASGTRPVRVTRGEEIQAAVAQVTGPGEEVANKGGKAEGARATPKLATARGPPLKEGGGDSDGG